MIYVSVSLFLTALVPIATGIFYSFVKDGAYDPEMDSILFFIVALVVAWGWPLVFPLAFTIAVVVGIVALTAHIVDKIKERVGS